MKNLTATDLEVANQSVFSPISLGIALLGLITPLLVIIFFSVWNSVYPLPYIDPVYDDGPMMSYKGDRVVNVLFYGFVWWLVMEILAGILAIIGFIRKESSSLKVYAAGLLVVNLIVPISFVFLYFFLLS